MQDLRVVVTGDVPGMERDAAQDAVRRMGGTVQSSVGATTDLLVVGTGAGPKKLARAAELRLRALPAEQFAQLAENPDRWDGRPLGTPTLPAGAGEADDGALPTEGEAMPRRPPAGQAGTAPQHVAGLCCWTRGGRWHVVLGCVCGHRVEAADLATAQAAHRRHQVDVGEPVRDG